MNQGIFLHLSMVVQCALNLWRLLRGRIFLLHSDQRLVTVKTCLGTTIKLPELVRILTVNIEYCNLNDSWGFLDVGRSVSAVQHHNGMNMGLLVNDGDRFCAAVNAVSPALPEQADIRLFTQQDTLLMQVLDLECSLRLKAQYVAAKSQGQYKADSVKHFCSPKQSWPNLAQPV